MHITDTQASSKKFLNFSTSAFRQFVRFSSKRIGQMQGILSRIIRVEIQWSVMDDDALELPKSVILKVPSTTAAGEIFDMGDSGEKYKEVMNFDRDPYLATVR